MNIPRIPLFSQDYMSISSSYNDTSINPSVAPSYVAPILSTAIPSTQLVADTQMGSTNTMQISPQTSSPRFPSLPTNDLRGVEKYRLIQKIGSGGQGSVYEAENKMNGRIVALKVLNIDSKNINSASRELATLEKISTPACHPFIVCYYNHYFDQINRQLFIEMEYIEGLTLAKWARKFTGPSLHNKLLLAIDDLCKALLFIHSQGIIHRDIKPENIIITTENVPKLIDFGLSCFTQVCYQNVACCKQDPGTFPYMAPETYAVRESYFVTDVWSLGVSFFVVSTGLYPFNFSNAKTIDEYRYIVLNNRPLALTTPNEKLNMIVNSCLNPNPATRITIPQIQAIIRS